MRIAGAVWLANHVRPGSIGVEALSRLTDRRFTADAAASAAAIVATFLVQAVGLTTFGADSV